MNTQLVEIYQSMAIEMRQIFRGAMAPAIGDAERRELDRIDAAGTKAIRVGSLTAEERGRLDARPMKRATRDLMLRFQTPKIASHDDAAAQHAYVHNKVQELTMPAAHRAPVEAAALAEVQRKGLTEPREMLMVVLTTCSRYADGPGQCEPLPIYSAPVPPYTPIDLGPPPQRVLTPYEEQVKADQQRSFQERMEEIRTEKAGPVKYVSPSPSLSPHRKLVDAAADELQALDKPNASTAKKVLRNLVKSGISPDVVEGVEGSLEDFISTVRSDYDSAEEYQDARQEAWDGFVADLEQIDLDDEEGEFDPYPEAPRPLLAQSGGIVVDPGLARSTPCIAMEVDSRRLIYSKGIIGSLNDEEQAAYCAEGVIEHRPTAAQIDRIKAMETAAPKCAAESDEVDVFLSCLARELRPVKA